MSGLFGNNIFTIAQKSLDFRTSRHDLLASNVANKDTPGYQAEDLVFRASLEKALQAEQPGPLKQTDSYVESYMKCTADLSTSHDMLSFNYLGLN